jgi:hypothetical protein
MWLLLSSPLRTMGYTLVGSGCCSGKFTHCRGSFINQQAPQPEKRLMPLGLPVAFLILAQAATASDTQHIYGPAPATPAKSAPAPTAGRECTAQPKPSNGNEIVVCAVKPEGYRLPPDVVEARRLKKQGDAVRPRSPHETYADHSCATVGPMGCRGAPTVDFIALAAVAAKISGRLAKGQEIGSVFETTPSSSEYQYYQEAKRRREAKEAQAAAAAAKAKAQAAENAKRPPADLTASAPTGH